MARIALLSMALLAGLGCAGSAYRSSDQRQPPPARPPSPIPAPKLTHDDIRVVTDGLPAGWAEATNGVPCCYDRNYVHAETGARVSISVDLEPQMPLANRAEDARRYTLQMQAYEATPPERILGGHGYVYQWHSTYAERDGVHRAGRFMVLTYPPKPEVQYSCDGAWTTETGDRVAMDFTAICLSISIYRTPDSPDPL